MRKTLLVVFLLLGSQHSSLSQWGPDINISNGTGTASISTGSTRSLAADGDTVYAAWWDNSTGNYEIYFNKSTNNGTTWEGAQRLTFDSALSENPSIAVSGHVIHVVWNDNRNAVYEIFYKRSTDGGSTWSTDTSLCPGCGGGNGGQTTVAASGQNVHVGWVDTRTTNWEIYYARSSDGGLNWSDDVVLSTEDENPSWYPAIAISGNYVYTAWWDYRDTTADIIFKASSDGGTTWGSEQRLTDDSAFSEYPSVAAFGPTVHVVWHGGPTNNDIHYKRSPDHGATWLPTVNLSNDSMNSVMPGIVAAGEYLHVAWCEYGDTTFLHGIPYSASTDLGASWSARETVASSPGAAYFPTLAVSGTTVHLAWIDTRDSAGTIYYKRNPTGNPAFDLMLDAGWNLVSIPSLLSDFSKTTVFPGATTDAFWFDGGYVTAETLTTGRGYWIKYPTDSSTSLPGTPILADTFDVSVGWNLIGSIAEAVDVTTITSIPPGMIVSPFFQYSHGYETITQLSPGRGYWVKTDSGQLVLTAPALSGKAGVVRIIDSGARPPAMPGGLASAHEAPTTGLNRIDAVFPNPFNPTTTIYFTLANEAVVELKVVNLLGETVATLVEGKQAEGLHSSSWNAGGAPTGVYFCRLTVRGETKTIKLLKVQ